MHTSQCFGASSGFMPELKVASGKQERNKNIDFFPCTCETEAFSITFTVCIKKFEGWWILLSVQSTSSSREGTWVWFLVTVVVSFPLTLHQTCVSLPTSRLIPP